MGWDLAHDKDPTWVLSNLLFVCVCVRERQSMEPKEMLEKDKHYFLCIFLVWCLFPYYLARFKACTEGFLKSSRRYHLVVSVERYEQNRYLVACIS